MKAVKHYIGTMYRPSYIVLCIGSALFAISLLILSLSMHQEILAGESDIIYRYPKMLEEVLFPLIIFLPITLGIDLNERKKKS